MAKSAKVAVNSERCTVNPPVKQESGEADRPPRFLAQDTPRATQEVRRSPVYILAYLFVLIALLSTQACAKAPSRIDRIRAQGVIRVATDPSFAPFESVDPEGQIVGFDVDLAQAIAEHIGVKAHFVSTGYDALYDALTADQADVIISGLYPDPSRSADFSFSTPYFQAGQVVVVPTTSDITDIAGLAGRTVGCVFGTEGHMAALQWEETLRPQPTIVTVDDPAAVMAHLVEGSVDAVLMDHVSALIASHQHTRLRILMPPVTDEPYVVAVRGKDGDLLNAVNEALRNLEADGTLDTLSDHWMQP